MSAYGFLGLGRFGRGTDRGAYRAMAASSAALCALHAWGANFCMSSRFSMRSFWCSSCALALSFAFSHSAGSSLLDFGGGSRLYREPSGCAIFSPVPFSTLRNSCSSSGHLDQSISFAGAISAR